MHLHICSAICRCECDCECPPSGTARSLTGMLRCWHRPPPYILSPSDFALRSPPPAVLPSRIDVAPTVRPLHLPTSGASVPRTFNFNFVAGHSDSFSLIPHPTSRKVLEDERKVLALIVSLAAASGKLPYSLETWSKTQIAVPWEQIYGCITLTMSIFVTIQVNGG